MRGDRDSRVSSRDPTVIFGPKISVGTLKPVQVLKGPGVVLLSSEVESYECLEKCKRFTFPNKKGGK